ncbi:MAG: hypothetical protein IJY39_02525 [Clostridia bacterium]|nr:hypothetical protein [Clostridia bacterium]MBQ9785198.1 hypothetical protein [Clostridia bacterium]
MKNKKMIFKRVAAAFGLVLALIPLVVLGVAAADDDIPTSWGEYVEWNGYDAVIRDYLGVLPSAVADGTVSEFGSYDDLVRRTDGLNKGYLYCQPWEQPLSDDIMSSQNAWYAANGVRQMSSNYLRGFVGAELGERLNTLHGVMSYTITYKGSDGQTEIYRGKGAVYTDVVYGRNAILCLHNNLYDGDKTYNRIEFVFNHENVDGEYSGHTNMQFSPYQMRVRQSDGGTITSYTLNNAELDIALYQEGDQVHGFDYVLYSLLMPRFSMAYQNDYFINLANIANVCEDVFTYAYDCGNYNGYYNGFANGETSALNGTNTFGDLVIGIFEAPGVLIESMLDFDILGINVAGFVKVLLTLSVTAAIVFFILKITKG